jgi:DNA invertase Pin-like site-specific DNA recombinase
MHQITKKPLRVGANSLRVRIALYARVSTEAQEEEGQSLSTQVATMQEAAVRIGAEVVQVYQVQESAMPGQLRPSLTRLMKDAAAGNFDGVMVCKLDRLARAIDVLTHVENQLRQFGIDLYEGADKHNLLSAEGRLTRGMQALIGEYAVNRLKWSACLSRLERAQRGWPHSGALPWGREIVKIKDRRNADAQWRLDEHKAEIAQELYKCYIEQGSNLAQVASRFHMNAETLRRILVDQSSGVWQRSFLDPTTGQHVTVCTRIPQLLSDEQIARVKERAKQNQLERAGWTAKRREYPLSHYVRCTNPDCGWSNLSGHMSTDRTAKTRPYYVHLYTKKLCGCTNYVPAEAIETEIFSRLGGLLLNSEHLAAAVRATVAQGPQDNPRLEAELVRVRGEAKRALRILENAMAVLIEERGTEAAKIAKAKVGEQERLLAKLKEQADHLEGTLKVTRLPLNFAARIEQITKRLVGLHGYAPIFWPYQAKRALLAMFFGGPKSTRFDRASRGSRSDERGIFITQHRSPEGERYWTYEARGAIANLGGAITRVVSLCDAHESQDIHRSLNLEEMRELATMADKLEGYLNFRVSPAVSTRSFA